MTRNYVLFKTDLFVSHQKEEDIDQWFVGGDCAGWFYARLLPAERIRPFCEPVMEDWGWTFAVIVDEVRVWVNVWAFDGMENCWLFGIEAKKRVFHRQTSEVLQRAKDVACDALDEIMARDPRILTRKWLTANPFDLNIQEL